MNKFIKLEIFILFLIFSVFIYLDYSFNNFNYYMNGAMKVSYTYKDTADNESIINELSEIADKSNCDIYYLVEDFDKILYQFTKEPVNDEKNYGTDKQIKYPNIIRKIEVKSINEIPNYNLSHGTLIIQGTTNDINTTLANMDNIEINDLSQIKHENSEFALSFIPLLIINILVIIVSINSQMKTQAKKIGIMYLEGYSKTSIIFTYLKKDIINTIYIILTVILIYSITMYSLNNSDFLIDYVRAVFDLFLVLICLILISYKCTILSFGTSSLKNLVDKRIAIVLLNIIKLIVLVSICAFFIDTGILAQKYVEQTKQMDYTKNLNDYYTYEIQDDGFYEESDTSNINATYKKLYEQTVDEFNGLLTVPSTCDVSESVCDSSDGIIVSPKYLQFYGTDLEYQDDNVEVYNLSSGDVSIKEIENTYHINDAPILINNLDTSTLKIINQDYQISEETFGYAIVLNQALIENSQYIQDNMLYLMQNYYFKIINSTQKNDFLSIINELNLTEQIRVLHSVNKEKLNDIKTIKLKIIKTIFLLIFLVCSFIAILIIINNILVQLVNRKLALMVLEGYEISEIFTNSMWINVGIFITAFIISIGSKHMYDFLSYIIVIGVYIILFVLEYVILLYVYQHKIAKAIKNILKGDT